MSGKKQETIPISLSKFFCEEVRQELNFYPKMESFCEGLVGYWLTFCFQNRKTTISKAKGEAKEARGGNSASRDSNVELTPSLAQAQGSRERRKR